MDYFLYYLSKIIIVNIDLGNFWEMLSAVGTVGAVIVALAFGLYKNKKPIKVKLLTICSNYGIRFKKPDNIGNMGEDLDLNNNPDEKEANLVEIKGRILFHNPSDNPKILADLKITADFVKKRTITTSMPFLESEKQYISLSPKETKVIDFNTFFSKEMIFNDNPGTFEQIKLVYLEAIDENGRSITLKLIEDLGISKKTKTFN